MLGIMIALLRSCFLSSTKKEDTPTVDDKPTVDVTAAGATSASGSPSAAGATLDASLRGSPKSPLRIRTPQGVICSSCPNFKLLDNPVEVEEWTCDRCVAGESPCQH
jgi:hypothetical protein